MHHVKFLTLVEIACWAVLTQHTAIPVARPMKQRLIERYGSALRVEGETYWAFPALEDLADLTPDDFRAIVPDDRRARALVAVVRALRAMDEAWLRTAPYDEAEAALRRIPGIGPWSAAFILLRSLGRMERMPLDMKAFLRILPRVYGPGVTLAQLAARYGDSFGYWGVYVRAAQ
jgi:DNA-3-methyladenine glycosylase II